MASITEDAAAINEMHDAVLGKTLFAVDAPDGEHDLEDVVSSIASCFRTIVYLHLCATPWCLKFIFIHL